MLQVIAEFDTTHWEMTDQEALEELQGLGWVVVGVLETSAGDPG